LDSFDGVGGGCGGFFFSFLPALNGVRGVVLFFCREVKFASLCARNKKIKIIPSCGKGPNSTVCTLFPAIIFTHSNYQIAP
jgi:hypothetical protein